MDGALCPVKHSYEQIKNGEGPEGPTAAYNPPKYYNYFSKGSIHLPGLSGEKPGALLM
jgi:hypothetical protein